ncbi:MAG TPA: hypothetical protein VGN20_22065 [Mucilaginibacter sp.]|jgi:hypothetical protein
MKSTKFFLAIAGFASLTTFISCEPSIKIIGAWINKEQIKPTPYKSVFVIALTGNLDVKNNLETNIAEAAAAKGLTVNKSVSVFGPFSGKESIPKKEKILATATDLKCEAIFTIALIDQHSETKYVPGTSTTYYSSYYPQYGYYSNFGAYYDYSYSYYEPGYYQTDHTYVIQASLFDTKSQLLVMSIESKATNPKEIQKSGKQYTQLLTDAIRQLREENK